MSAPALRLGTRASALALTQSGHVATALRGLGREVDLVRVQTAGDLSRDAITQLGGNIAHDWAEAGLTLRLDVPRR